MDEGENEISLRPQEVFPTAAEAHDAIVKIAIGVFHRNATLVWRPDPKIGKFHDWSHEARCKDLAASRWQTACSATTGGST